jgi:tRNA-dihydrouridine synthase C
MLQLLYHYWNTVTQHISERHRNGRIKQWLLYLSRCYPQAQESFDVVRRVTEPADIELILFSEFTASAAAA